MKMTIVLDSDDREGINDALKMVRIMHRKYSSNITVQKISLVRLSSSSYFASICVSLLLT